MRFAIATAALLAFAGAAAAQTTRKVPQDYDTIQEAEDDCDPGDTIKIAKGRYFENVTLNVADVTITGSGVIWDGTVGAVEATCLTISASGVVVQGITFRNGYDQILCSGGDLTVSKCTFIESSHSGINVNNNPGCVITSCKFMGIGDDCVETYVNETTISKCTVRSSYNDGFYISGADGTISGNTTAYNEAAQPIYISGNDGVVEKNKVLACGGGEAIYVEGTSAKVSGNTLKQISDDNAIYVDGADSLVEKNKITDTRDGIEAYGTNVRVLANKIVDFEDAAGIYVEADGFTVSGNSVAFGVNDAYGYGLYSDTGTGGGTIENNKCAEVADGGFYFGANLYNTTVSNCSAKNCGSQDEEGIYVSGNDNDFTNLTVSGIVNTGIRVNGGNSNEFFNCKVTNALGDGFRVSGTNHEFTNCSATNCGSDGFDNRGTGTKVTGGKFRGERFDVTNTGGTFSGGLGSVDFVTGGSTQVSEVD